ncbi:MAG: PDC sensor domain-containing protein [Deltaproteobacteria bacterium]|nr:PDC sensor domain-containing protein [Deltaproteobacteria bacterium]
MQNSAIKSAVITLLLSLFAAASVFAAPDKGTVALLAKVQKAVGANKELSKGTMTLTIKSLLPMATNAVFIKTTKAQNAKKVPLDTIKDIDQKWIKAESELPIQKEVRENECAKEVIKQVKAVERIVEAFVMDDQGAVVCENNLTSDYWQGDEEKWTNSYNGGKGGLDVSKVKFDKSANKNLQQISIPVIDKGGKVIGAITFGVDVTGL